MSFGIAPADADRSGVVIEDRDATAWWHTAASLWRNPTGADVLQQQASPECVADNSDIDACVENRRWEEETPRHPSTRTVVASPMVSTLGASGAPPASSSAPAAAPAVSAAPAEDAAPADAASNESDDSAHQTRSSLRGSPGSPQTMRYNTSEEYCSICCNDVQPDGAVRLGCSHGWYCQKCVFRHAEARLAAGSAVVNCPECCTSIAERDLRKLLPTELMERFLSRSLEQAVSSAADLWACPTPNCPMRVALEEGELPRLKCTVCKKSSCLKCSAQPYHRGSTCEEHRAKTVNSGKRKRDEGWSDLMKWMEETGAKQCPTCRTAVTKQNLKGMNTQYSECHKMMCRQCNTRFCFRCLAVLTDSYSCGCSIDAHGFVDPRTGKRVNHLRRGAVAKAKGKGKAKAKLAPKQKARGR